MSKTSLLSGWVSPHTVEARVDSKFWYGLADRFRLCAEAGEISARVNVCCSGVPNVSWTPSPIRYSIARSQFERLALEAWSGIKLPADEHNQGGGIYFGKMVGAWLDIVWGCVLVSQTLLESHKEDGVECARTIHRVCEASAIVCTYLANEAREFELDGHANQCPLVPSPARVLPITFSEEELLAARAASRRAWMENRHPGDSLCDWARETKIDYKTLRNYRDGETTRQTRGTRQKLAKAENVDYSLVPE
jgi:hypothetical protein